MNAMTTRDPQQQTITKKHLVDRISDDIGTKRVVVKQIVQLFLDEIIKELGNGNRLEFRDFGVFEIRERAPRTAQNPKTMEKVAVPKKRTVKFKIGRLMKQLLQDELPKTAEVMKPSLNHVSSGTHASTRSIAARVSSSSGNSSGYEAKSAEM
ncbi:MAG: HU family DNA-binding protein [Phycisphaerae bacterium]